MGGVPLSTNTNLLSIKSVLNFPSDIPSQLPIYLTIAISHFFHEGKLG